MCLERTKLIKVAEEYAKDLVPRLKNNENNSR